MDIFTVLFLVILHLTVTCILAFFLNIMNSKDNKKEEELSGDKSSDMKTPMSNDNTNKTRDGNISPSGNCLKTTDIADRACENPRKSTCMADRSSGNCPNATEMADKSSESCHSKATDMTDRSSESCPPKTTDMTDRSSESCPPKTTDMTDKSSESCHPKAAVTTDKSFDSCPPKATNTNDRSSERCPPNTKNMIERSSESYVSKATVMTETSCDSCPPEATYMTDKSPESCQQATDMPKDNKKDERDKSMPTGTHLGKKSKAQKKKNKKAERSMSSESSLVIKPKGLPNIGMTCFMNSILQCLIWTPGMEQQLKLQVEKLHNYGNRKDIAHCLLGLINDVQSGHRKGTVAPKTVKKLLIAVSKRNSQFSGYDQQDSYEMFNAIVSGMEDEILNQNKDDKNDDSMDVTDTERVMNICPVTRLFGGMYVTVYEYSSCDHIEIDFQRFTSICVPVPCETLPDKMNTKNRHRESVLSTDVYSSLDYEDVLINPNNDKTYWGADESELYFQDCRNLINTIKYERHIKTKCKDYEKHQSENYQMEPRTEREQMRHYSQKELSRTEEVEENLAKNCSSTKKKKRKKLVEKTGTTAMVTDPTQQISNNEHEKEDLDKVQNSDLTVKRKGNLKRKQFDNDELLQPPKKRIKKSVTCYEMNKDYNDIAESIITNDDHINPRTTNCKNRHKGSKNKHERKEKVKKTPLTRGTSADGQCNGFNNMDTSTHADSASTPTVMNTEVTSTQNEADPMEVDIPEVSSHDTNEQAKQVQCGISEPDQEIQDEILENEANIKDHMDHTNNTSKPYVQRTTENTAAHFETITNNACGMNKLEKGLDELTTIEEFSENDLPCGTCNSLGATGRCYKKLMIMLPPPVLVLQINRFKPSQYHGQLEKIQSDVSYPENLDLSPFVSSAYKLLNNKAGTTTYSLYGVVCHSGSIRGGHYYAYIKTSRNNTENLHRHFLEEKWSDPERLKDKILDFWRTGNVPDNIGHSMSGACTKQDSGDMSTESNNGTAKCLSYPVKNGETDFLKHKNEIERTCKQGITEPQNKEGGEDSTKKVLSLHDTRARWYYISDSMVLYEKNPINALQDKSAYILMYKLAANKER